MVVTSPPAAFMNYTVVVCTGCMQVNADLAQQSHRAAAAHGHGHEEHSHSHHSHAVHSETHSHSDQSDSHSAHSHSHEDHRHHHDHVHDDSVSSVSIKLDGSMNVQSVNAFLGHIISMNPENMYRYKGIVAIAGTDDRVVFQVSISAHALSRNHDTPGLASNLAGCPDIGVRHLCNCSNG